MRSTVREQGLGPCSQSYSRAFLYSYGVPPCVFDPQVENTECRIIYHRSYMTPLFGKSSILRKAATGKKTPGLHTIKENADTGSREKGVGRREKHVGKP
jgi:hypothetical protein